MIDTTSLLPKILDAASGRPELIEAAVRIAWSRAAGAGLRHHAVASRFNKGALVVSVGDAIWQKQLLPMRAELIFRVNKLLRRQVVSSIEFRIDPATLTIQAPSRSINDRERSNKLLPPELIAAAVEITDSELRQRFLRAAENCIARRDTLNQS